MKTPTVSTLREGQKVEFKSGLVATFSHFDPTDSPVFIVRHNGYTNNFLLSHLKSTSPLSKLELV